MRSPSQMPPAALYLRGPAPSSALGMLACLEVVRRPRGVQPSAGPQRGAPCVSSTLGHSDATWVSCVRVQFLSTGDNWEPFTAHTVQSFWELASRVLGHSGLQAQMVAP